MFDSVLPRQQQNNNKTVCSFLWELIRQVLEMSGLTTCVPAAMSCYTHGALWGARRCFGQTQKLDPISHTKQEQALLLALGKQSLFGSSARARRRQVEQQPAGGQLPLPWPPRHVPQQLELLRRLVTLPRSDPGKVCTNHSAWDLPKLLDELPLNNIFNQKCHGKSE